MIIRRISHERSNRCILDRNGWGDGEWMRNWVEQMEGAGATVVGGEDTICQEAPDADAQDELKAMGKQLAAI